MLCISRVLQCWLLVAGLGGTGVGATTATATEIASDTRFPLQAVGTRLVDVQGQEFRLVGDAAWTLIVGLTLDEADEYLASRQAAGFNTILVELVERLHTGPRNQNGDLPFPADAPFTSPSADYFGHAQAVLDLALKHQFLVLLAPAYLGYGCGKNGWCNQMRATPDAVLENYGHFVGRLMAGYPNIIWVHGGDVDARQARVLDKVEAVYRGINAELPGALHTAHCSRNFSAVDCYDRPWLNVNTTYSDCERTPERVVLDRTRVTGMPSIYLEGRYEEEQSTAQCVRSQLWWSFLGGSVGHVFGNRRIWLSAPDWRDALHTPGTRAMSVASKLLADHAEPAGLTATVDAPALHPAAESPLTVDVWASAWRRLWNHLWNETWTGPYRRFLDWFTVVDLEGEIPVATSATTTIAYLPYLTRFKFDGHHKVRCWIDPRTGTVLPVPPAAGPLQSPDGQDWLFVAEVSPKLCVSATAP